MNGTYVSLFSGIGGLDLALEAWGYRCVGQVEWDPHCTRVLERWWPDVPRWSDVRGFTAAAYAERSELQRRTERGVLASATSTGTGEGLQRQRGSDTAGDGYPADPGGHRPERRGPTSDADRRRLVGIGAQASGADPDEPRRDDALGLGDEPVGLICGGFPCQPVSTAGRRKGQSDDRWLWPEFARVVGELGPRYVLVENVPGLLTVNGGRAFSEVLGDLASMGYDATWGGVRAADVGAPHRRERIFILAAHPDHRGHEPELRPPHLTGAEAAIEAGPEPGGAGGRATADTGCDARQEGHADLVAAAGNGGEPTADAEDTDGRVGEARSAPGEGVGGRGSRGEAPFAWGPYAPAIGRWERVMGPAPHPVDDKGRLAPPFVEWMMGFPAGWVEGMTRTQALKALGNAVVPQQGAVALEVLA